MAHTDSDWAANRGDWRSMNQGVVDHTERQGLGLAKHVRTRHLWLQAARDEGWLYVVKIRTDRNPADLLTSTVSRSCASSWESNTTKTT